jgi:glutamyl-tRNA synthetase
LANVLDDIEQGITHVIRGDDHVENTYKHIALYQAMGAKVPIFAHLPMITNSNGKPYSKRDGDAFVGDFRKNGFLSDALFNYLALLGWSPGDDREILSRHEMIELFSLDRCQSSPAQVDIKKLTWINYEYMLQVPDHEFRIEIEKELKKDGIEYDKATLEKVIPLIRDRVKIFSDIAPLSRFLFQDDYQYNEKAVKKKLIRENVKENLERLCKHFLEVEIFNADSLEQILHDFVESNEIGLAEIMPPLRVCVSGQQGGPDLCPVLELLGREEVVHRIERAIEKFL